MTLKDALTIVLSLAEDNAIDEFDDLFDESLKQQTAICIVNTFALTLQES